MAQILVRNLNEKTVKVLKKRAKSQGRSLQAEVKLILEEAANSEKVDMETARKSVNEVRKKLKGRKFSDSAKLIREDRDGCSPHMQNHYVVRTEHLNHKGNLFGGQLLQWVDECAYMAAKKDFPEHNLVTRAMSEVEFKKGITNGSILQINADQERVGNTSVTYKIEVLSYPPEERGGELVFETHVTFVAIDDFGEKAPLIR